MPEIKLTKTELRMQQYRLKQLQTYLPTLQLKKSLLQAEVHEARMEIAELEEQFSSLNEQVDQFAPLLNEKVVVDLKKIAVIKKVHKRYENIAGVQLPYYEGIDFEDFHYDLFETPPWFEAVVTQLRNLAEARAKVGVAREKKTALENELRAVSIRVNLFEKVLIPRAQAAIKKIKVFLGDQLLAAVSRAKVVKEKLKAD